MQNLFLKRIKPFLEPTRAKSDPMRFLKFSSENHERVEAYLTHMEELKGLSNSEKGVS